MRRNHSRRKPRSPLSARRTPPSPDSAVAAEREAQWTKLAPSHGAAIRADSLRMAGGRVPGPPPPLTKEQKAKMAERQAMLPPAGPPGRVGFAEETMVFAGALADQFSTRWAGSAEDMAEKVKRAQKRGPGLDGRALGTPVGRELRKKQRELRPERTTHIPGRAVSPSAAAAGLHQILREVVLEQQDGPGAEEAEPAEEQEGELTKQARSERMARDIALTQWIAELEGEQESFPSVLLYCEHKLREAFASPVKQVSAPPVGSSCGLLTG